MNIGQRIKSKRELLNIPQTDLAKKVGISKQTLYKYENGIVTNIPSNIVEALAYNLDCSPAFLMGWESEKEVDKSIQTNDIGIIVQKVLNNLDDYSHLSLDGKIMSKDERLEIFESFMFSIELMRRKRLRALKRIHRHALENADVVKSKKD